MVSVINALRGEHANIGRLLDVLERQVAMFEDGRGPDYEIIDSILEYFLDYPELCHHPKEDLVYRRLLRRDPGLRERIPDLKIEHLWLGGLTRRLAKVIRNVHLDAEMPRRQVAGLAREFLDAYREHIRMEEDELFIAALSHLDSEDWAEIAMSVNDPADPLFGPGVGESFQALYREIMTLEDASRAAEPQAGTARVGGTAA